MTSWVRIEGAGPVREVVLARPEKRNALTVEMYAALGEAFDAAERDDAVQVLLLRGEGACFCAGNDIGDFLAHRGGDAAQPAGDFIRRLPVFGKPLVAAVQGPATGIGATVLLHCDLVVGAAGAQLIFPFVRLGLVPEAGSSLLLPRILGPQRAAELLLLGEPLPIERAREWGLVNRVVSPELLAAEARALAAALATRPLAAVQATRRMLRGDPTRILERITAEVTVFRKRLESPEFRAAAEAFLKRKA